MIDLENGRRYLNQWELDQRVQIDNFLPGTWVEFYHRNDCKSSTLITEAYEENGHVFADIPNAFLQTHGYLHVRVNPSATDTAHQPEEKDIKIVRKEKPENYTYTETPAISYKSLADRVRVLELEGVSDEQVAKAVEKYLDENPIEAGVKFETDNTLMLEDGVLSVNTTDQMEQDNTLPMTSAGVYTVVGNIEALLKTI